MVCAYTVTDDACTVQQELVKRRSSLLLKYIRRDTAKFELEALYAVQLIVHRHGHPYGLCTHCTLIVYTRCYILLYFTFTEGQLSNAQLACMRQTILTEGRIVRPPAPT